MTEDKIEDYFVKRVEETGGEVRKVVWPGRRGAPDRLAGWPNARHGLVELKRPKGKAESHQLREHSRLRSIGFPVDVISTHEQVDAYVERMSGVRELARIAVSECELSVRTTNVLNSYAPGCTLFQAKAILGAGGHAGNKPWFALGARGRKELAEVLASLA